MRLGTCLALEAVVGAALLGGAGVGAWYGVAAARSYVAGLGEARAATLPSPPPVVVPLEAHLEIAVAPVAVEAAAPVDGVRLPVFETVYPGTDAELLAPLRDGGVVGTKVNRGGSSLSLRIDLDTGGRAAFKPEQTWTQSRPRKEIAAYRIDRYLHIGRVPPAVARSFEVDAVLDGFPAENRRIGAARVREEGIARGGRLAGSASWWIPEITGARINGFDVDSTDGVVTWRRMLQVGARIDEEDRWLVEQLSTLTLFDFVIDNIDRWTGGNVRIAPGGRELFFMDNTMSFTPDKLGHRKGQIYLERVEVFSRDLVGRLRAMTEDDLHAIMDPDHEPFEYLLSDKEIRATLARRDYAIAYIDRLIARHGDDAVLAFR